MMKVRLFNDGGYATIEHLNFPMVVNAEFDDEFDDSVSAIWVSGQDINPQSTDSKILVSRYWFANDHELREFEVVDE